MSLTDTLRQKLATIDGYTDSLTGLQEAGDDEMVAAPRRAALIALLTPVAECAAVLAAADGSADAAEQSKIAARLSELTNGGLDKDTTTRMVGDAIGKVQSNGADAVVSDVAGKLSSNEAREAAFMVGANAAWAGGVSASEGVAMQSMAKGFGWEISHMQKLLGQAKG